MAARPFGLAGGLSPDEGLSDAGARLSILFSLAIIVFHASLAVAGLLGAAFAKPPGWATLLTAAAAAVTAICVGARELIAPDRRAAAVLWVAGAAAAVVIGSSLLAGALIDGSYDGQAYHQSAVAELARGWNPVAAVENVGTSFDIWIVHYPKGSWLQAAAFYGAVDSIEHAKGAGFSLAAAAFSAWLALGLILAPRRRMGAAALALIATVNPVAMSQAFTFMVDGQLASLFSACLALGGLLFLRLGRGSVLAALGCGVMLIALVKFTGLAYVMLLIAGLASVSFIRRPTLSRSLVAVVLGGALLLAVGVIGYDTYVVNAVRHGSPFFPLSGEDPIDVITAQMPGELAGKGRIEKLARGVFSRAANEKGPGTGTTLKVPFTIIRKELTAYWAPDTRVAGLGPLFGGALLLAVLLASAAVARSEPRRDERVRFALAGIAIVSATLLANAESWWARLAPQLWLIPVMVAGALILADSTAVLRRAGWLLIGLLFANSVIVGGMSLSRQTDMTRQKHAMLADFARAPEGVRLQLNTFDELTLKFAERGIAYTVIPDDAEVDSAGTVFPNTPAVVYVP